MILRVFDLFGLDVEVNLFLYQEYGNKLSHLQYLLLTEMFCPTSRYIYWIYIMSLPLPLHARLYSMQ